MWPSLLRACTCSRVTFGTTSPIHPALGVSQDVHPGACRRHDGMCIRWASWGGLESGRSLVGSGPLESFRKAGPDKALNVAVSPG